MPQSIIHELALVRNYTDSATLADGSEVLFDVYGGSLIWDGQYQEIEIISSETEPLLGMRLLRGTRTQLDVIEGGLVTIQSIPT